MDDKNYLGLGVIFRAVDDGYTKSINKSVKKAQDAQKILDKVGSVQVSNQTQKYAMPQEKSFDINPESFSMDIGGITDSHKLVVKSFKQVAIEKDKLIDNFKLYQDTLNKTAKSDKPIKKSSRDMSDIFNSMGRILKHNAGRFGALGKAVLLFSDPLNKMISGTGKVSDLAKSLDLVQTKMAVVFGPEQAQAFNKELISAVRNYGVTAEQVGDIAQKLNQWGVPIERSNKLMPTMAKMVGVMGMDAGTVADMFGATTQRLGMSVDGAKQLTAEVFAAGQEHGLMDMLENMPGFVETVTDSFNRMGVYNTKAATATIKQMTNLTIMYNKMGISQKQAAEGAKKVQMGVSSIITDIKRMQVGLDPKDMEGMINVAAELSRTSGMGFEETLALMEKGPQAVQEKMLEISKNLSKEDRFRLGEIMGEKFGDEFALGLKSDQAKAAIESVMSVEVPKADKAAESLDRAITMQSKTFTMQEKLLQQNQELVKALGELQAKQSIISGWQAQIKGLQDMQDVLNPLMKLLARFESAGFSGFFEAIGYVGGVVKAIKVLGETISGITPIFKSLWETTKSVAQAFTKFFGGFTRSFKVFSKGIGSVAKLSSKLLGPIGAALGFIDDGMDALKEKSIGGGIATLLFGKSPEKNIKDVGMSIASQGMKWGGIGATIGTFIFPGIGTAIGAGIGAALGAIGALIRTYWGDITAAFSGLTDKISKLWSKTWNGLKNGWESIKGWFSGVWTSMSESAVNMFSRLWENLKSGFSSSIEFIKNALGGVWDGLKNGWESIKGWFSGVWTSMGELASNAFSGLWDNVKSGFSSSVEFIKSVFDGIWDGLKGGISSYVDYLKNAFTEAVQYVSKMFSSIPGASAILEKVGNMFASNEPEKKPSLDKMVPAGPEQNVSPDKMVSTNQSENRPIAEVKPIQAQEQAPKISRVSKYEPKFKEKDSGNTLDDVVKSIVDLRNMIQSSMGQPTPVNIVLDADAKKFLKVVKTEMGSSVSVAGMSNALGGA